ncbi:DUF1697 domain-containing protein [Demetria terragena]|uniref:DUF1697 domain-containing protein n=1 Tax=Demetria terragena TaxID=63959 RepID=UPI000372B3C2|nr:DUF1697 domain-containing protein [Demetria terragena]
MTAEAPLQVILLRGVNVGGYQVKSARLTACLKGIPDVTAVKTVLASGNAVVRTPHESAELQTLVESALREEFDHDAKVVVLSLAEVTDLADRCPYPFDDRAMHAYLTLASDPTALDAWEQAARELAQEHRRLSPEALAWTCPVGDSLGTPFAKAQSKQPLKRYTSAVTTRNGRTLIRILAAAEVMPPRTP